MKKLLFIFAVLMCFTACKDSGKDEPSSDSNSNSVFGSWLYQDTWTGTPQKFQLFVINKDNHKRMELNTSGTVWNLTVYDFKWKQPTNKDAEDKVNALLEGGCWTEAEKEQYDITFEKLIQGLRLGEYAEDGVTYFEIDPQYTITHYKYNTETKTLEPNGSPQSATYPYWFNFMTLEGFELDDNGEQKSVYRLKAHHLMCQWALMGIGPEGHRYTGESTPGGLINYVNKLLTPQTPDPSEYLPYGANYND